MTDFNVNTSTRLKQGLKRRVSNALQWIELLKKKDGWIALLEPDRLRLPRRGRAGFTLTETLFVLIVVITVLVSVVVLYNGVVDTTRTAALRSQLTRAVAIIQRGNSRSAGYGAADADLLVFLNDKGFSEDELKRLGQGSYEFFSPYGGQIAIVAAADRQFTVTVGNLPSSACEAAISAFAGGSGFVSAAVGSATSTAGLPELVTGDAVALTDNGITTACDVAVPVTVTLTFN